MAFLHCQHCRLVVPPQTASFQRTVSPGKVVLDLLQSFVFGFGQENVEVDGAKEGNAAVQYECPMSCDKIHKEGKGLDDDEDENVGGHVGNAADDAADLDGVNLTHHNPWDDEETESAAYGVTEDAENGEPGPDRDYTISIPERLEPHVATEAEHGTLYRKYKIRIMC